MRSRPAPIKEIVQVEVPAPACRDEALYWADRQQLQCSSADANGQLLERNEHTFFVCTCPGHAK